MLKIQAEISWIKNFLNNYFILIIIFMLLLVIWFWFFNNSFNNINRDSYIVLLKWWAELNNTKLNIDNKKKINIWDVVTTTSNDALAVLEWWDGSVTRLWWNTTIKINNLYLSDDLDKINISFELLNWKTRSTVLSFLWKWSYFNESFTDSVAAVRGTVFDIDLDKNYLYVIDHKVEVTNKNTNKSYIIDEKKPFNIETFNFISLDKFIKTFKDKTWEWINTKIDDKMFKLLEKQIKNDLNNLVDINSIDIQWSLWDDKKRQELYNKILKDYQKLNFIKSNNNDLFKKKIELKDALIKLSDNENKDYLLKNIFYDFNDIVKSKNYWAIDKILPILWDNKNSIEKLNLWKNIDFNKLPNDIKEKFSDFKFDYEKKIKDFKSVLDDTNNLLKNKLDWVNINFNN